MTNFYKLLMASMLFLSARNFAQGQALAYVPSPMAGYVSSNGTGASGSWNPISGSGGGTALTYSPPAAALYYSSDGTGNLGTWVPCTAICGSGGAAASVPFSGITNGMNTQAAMVIGTGASLTISGSGVNNANQINGTALSGLATGLLKNTTTIGVPSIAVLGTDYGNVVGPASSTANDCANYADTTGKLLADAGGPCALTNAGNVFTAASQTVNTTGSTIPGTIQASTFQDAVNGANRTTKYVFGSSVTVEGDRADGTAASPTALASNDTIVTYGAGGWTTTPNWIHGTSFINIQASENWTAANTGSRITFTTTANSAGGRAIRETIENDGGIFMAGATGGSEGVGTFNATGVYQNGVLVGSAAGTGIGLTTGTIFSNAVYQLSFQPGLLTSVTSTIAIFSTVSKASTVDNITGSAYTFSCVSNPTIQILECATSTTCASPTVIGSVTVTAAGTATVGTVSNPAITAGDFVGWRLSAGTCTSLDISANAQVHSN